jgi:hypothetical protein
VVSEDLASPAPQRGGERDHLGGVLGVALGDDGTEEPLGLSGILAQVYLS